MKNSSPIAYIRRHRKTMASISLLVAGMQVFGYSNFLTEGKNTRLRILHDYSFQSGVKDFDMLFPYNLNDESTFSVPMKNPGSAQHEIIGINQTSQKSEIDFNGLKDLRNFQSVPKNIKPIRVQSDDVEGKEETRVGNKQGIIGKSELFPIDDPRDNTFAVSLEKLPNEKQEVYLVYELFGLADASGASVSINDQYARGGYLVKKSNNWTIQKEKINPEDLNEGINIIRFSTLESPDYQYMVKDVHLELGEPEQKQQGFSINQTKLNSYDGHLYISGFTNENIENLIVDGKNIPVKNGIFEVLIDSVDDEIIVSDEGEDTHFMISRTEDAPDKLSKIPEGNIFSEKMFSPALENSISQEGAVLTVPAGSLEKEIQFFISALHYQDISVISPEMVNVTGNSSGFRLLPHGEHFVNSPATLEIPYDETKIPAGYKPQDIKTFYFDQQQAKWIALERDTVLLDKKIIVSKTTHFTDFINGVIKVPESPETGSFTPTSIKDIKAADPAAGIVSIPPPTPNNMGTATTSFPIKLPAGRAGMQPSLSVNYNSEGGNGWMGIGWDLSIPSISIDTRWGAPRYDPHEETEIYSMAGEMLTMQVGSDFTNPHRTSNITRTSDRVFYPRKEDGSYLNIKRHGSNPTNYWWEVIDKMGNKSFYGGYTNVGVIENAIIRTKLEDGNNIAHWALYRTEDTNGNYVQYTYETTNYTGSGAGNGGTEFYLKRIDYTLNSGTSVGAYYKVDFIRNAYSVGAGSFTERKDININGRLGLVQVVSDNLTEIRIDYVYKEPQRIRTYRFDYDDPNFSKQQLTKISEYDANDDLFYSNTLEYYSEVSDGNFVAGPTEINADWNGYDDGISQNLTLPNVDDSSITDEGSPLGFSTGWGINGGVSAGVGLGFNILSKGATAGVTFDYSYSQNAGVISFVDIDGDNLPDKVIRRDNGNFTYRPNLGEGLGFGEERDISGINYLSQSTSNSYAIGGEANFGIYIGYTKNWSKSVTKRYLADVNGDGLVDLVDNGLVKFNKSYGSGVLGFSQYSIDSPNSMESGNIDPAIVGDLNLETLEDLKNDNPLHDVVKVWTAPKSGTVNITGSARLVPLTIPPFDDEYLDHYDGVKLTIEKGGSNLKPPQYIDAKVTQSEIDNQTPINMSVSSISVNKGNRIFFRVNSREEGSYDRVEWNPIVTYTGSHPLDANGFDYFSSSAEEGFIMSGKGGMGLPANSSISLNWPTLEFTQQQFSDDLLFLIKREKFNTDGSISLIGWYAANYNHISSGTTAIGPDSFSRIAPPPIVSVNLSSFHAGSSDEILSFSVLSNSNVDWKSINWKPTVSIDGAEPIIGVVDYGIYNLKLSSSNSRIDNIDTSKNVIITYDFQDFNIPASMAESLPEGQYDVNMVIKNSQKRVLKTITATYEVEHHFPFYIEADLISVSDSSPFTIIPSANLTGSIFVEFYTTNPYIATYGGFVAEIKQPNESGGFNDRGASKDVYAKSLDYLFGAGYRNWGQFIYNGTINSGPINENDLLPPSPPENDVPDEWPCGDPPENPTPEEEEDYENCVTEFVNSLDIEDPRHSKLIYMSPNPNKIYGWDETETKHDVWSGNDKDTDIDAGSFTSSRFGVDDIETIYVEIPTDADLGLVRAINLISKGDGNSYAGNVSVGGFGAGASMSDSDNKAVNYYLDMNGDRYPDILTDQRVQYTSPTGKLAETRSSVYGGNPVESKTNGWGATVSGTFKFASTPAIDQKYQKALLAEQGVTVDAESPVQVQSVAGLSANAGEGTSSEEKLWVDMNGDGLPDRIEFSHGMMNVSLNMGYEFGQSQSWLNGPGEVTSENHSYSGGIGFSMLFNSFSGGVSVSATNGYTVENFVDLNGDGLPEFLSNPEEGIVNYRLNLGDRFSSSTYTIQKAEINSTRSVGEGANIAFTFGFTALLAKFTITPRVAFNHSMERTEYTITDINGDGYVDLAYNGNQLSSTNDGDLKVRLNKTGKTHLLKQVNTPLGGSWEIDYHREGNTYEMPQSKWALDEITTHDGFAGDHTFTPDETITTVEYTNPHHDRREREFMGFETVRVNQIDVMAQSQQDNIYRYSVQEFYNNLYYLKGAVKKESLFGKNAQGNMVEWTSTENTYAIMARGETNPSNTVEDAGHVFDQGDFGLAIDKASLFVSPIRTTKKFTEGGSGLKETYTEIQLFDANGNIKKYVDNGEGGNDVVTTEINYLNNATFRGLPTSIDVKAGGILVRHRGATYNTTTGNLTSVTTRLNGSDNAVVAFDYDAYGNIQKVTHENSIDENGDPFYYQYTYDNKVYTYPVLVEDAFGYSSNSTYDYRFGALVYTEDMNYMPMRTRIDDRGRVMEITGPYELFVEGLTTSDPAWTIRFEYENESSVAELIAHQELEFTDYVIDAGGRFVPDHHNPDNNLHHAVTRHFDPEFRQDPETPVTNNEIYTITLVDGLGKPVQVKKSTSLLSTTTTHTGEPDFHVIDDRDKMVWLINGKVKTDAFGRALKTYYPTTQTFNSGNPLGDVAVYAYMDDVDDENIYTEAKYDALDRVTETTLPGENVSMTTAYAIDNGLFKTTVTNELGQVKQSFTDVRGRTVKVEELSAMAGTITTEFAYNAIGELLEVEDTDGNITESKYDLAGRRTELRHPDNGITKFTYDKASNLIAKETSTLLADGNGEKIEYSYTFNRLDSIVYPKNPHNNVHFFYGQAQDASAADDFSVGRLWYQIDATGVQQFKYGRLGEVRYNLRSVAVPGDKAYWFKTEWEYDTWNRVKKIIYPDEEEVTYFYNRGGELHAMTSKKDGHQNDDIISQIGYDKFGQRTYLRYGNGTETTYKYEPERRRLGRMDVKSSTAFGSSVDRLFVRNNYTYDILSNVLTVENIAPNPTTGLGMIGGATSYAYTYDDLNRLTYAEGDFTGSNAADDGLERQHYELTMAYDKLHNIVSKEQLHQKAPGQSGGTFTDIPTTTYALDYVEQSENDGGYGSAGYNVAGYQYTQPHAPRKIIDKPYTTSTGNDIKTKLYDYDENGNLTAITQTTGDSETVEKLRTNLWDEENRLRAVDITPDAEGVRPIAIYTYDAGGERVLKHSNTSVSIYLNGKKVADTIQTDAILYPSGMLVAKLGNNGNEEEQTLAYTKHYYAGTQRVSSKIGTTENLGDFLQDWITQGLGGPVDAIGSSMDVLENAEEGVVQVYTELGIAPPSYESSPTFIPVESFTHGDDENEIYWFHPDHLGSTSYITNVLGEVSQHMEYFAFGETFVEEHRSSNNSPYKFNGKELDEETGWYYYGARYYDPRLSVWLSIDPLASYDPINNSEHYIDGQHNGGVFNAMNLNVYGYTYQNPLRYVDPNGKQVDVVITNEVVGTTQIRLIGHDNYEDAPSTVTVNLYRMTVTDRTTGTKSNYSVTRDAPVAYATDNDWFSDNETYVKNTAFEPDSETGEYMAVPLAYPHGTDLEALALRNKDGSSSLKTDSDRQLPPGGKKGSASGVMIHVGGSYKRKDGTISITGSFGCFGVETGNSGITDFIKDITNRQNKNTDKSINITVQKRDNVDWKYVVGSDGEKTNLGL